MLLSTTYTYLNNILSLYIKIRFIHHMEHHVNTVFSVMHKHNTDNMNNVINTEKLPCKCNMFLLHYF
jgi:hypothetical protein